MPGDNKKLESLERRVRMLEAFSDESSWGPASTALAVCVGVLALSLLLPWLGGGEDSDDVEIGVELVRGFELTPADSSILPDGVATLGAFSLWFLLLVMIPALVYALRASAAPAAVAGVLQFVLLGWFVWAATIDLGGGEQAVARIGSGLLVCTVTVVLATLFAIGKSLQR